MGGMVDEEWRRGIEIRVRERDNGRIRRRGG